MTDDRERLRTTFDSAADDYPIPGRRLDERADGRLRRGWGAVLHVARRTDEPSGR